MDCIFCKIVNGEVPSLKVYEDTLIHLMSTVKKVAKHCVDECGYEGVNLLNASDESDGQSVPHFHIHIIPRKSNDNVDAWPKFDGANCEIEDI